MPLEKIEISKPFEIDDRRPASFPAAACGLYYYAEMRTINGHVYDFMRHYNSRGEVIGVSSVILGDDYRRHDWDRNDL